MANEKQIEYWNGAPSVKWVRHQTAMDAAFERHGIEMLDAASLASGMTVLDVGCGCGATSLEAGRRVGPSGRVLGVDISAPMLERATERAAQERLTNVGFERTDAQTDPLDPEKYDAVVSRLGVMFFDDPCAAFTNLHGALRRGGRLAFACWQATAVNPWISVPMDVVSNFVATEPMDGTGPGPFSFAASGRVHEVLGGAGFVESHVRDTLIPIIFGRTVDEAAHLLILLGPAGRALLSSEQSVKNRAAAAVAERLTPFATSWGVTMESRVWIVTARRAG